MGSVNRDEDSDLNQRLIAEQRDEEDERQNQDILTSMCDEYKQLWSIVGPAIFSRVAGFLMNVVSQALPGHLGEVELASISIANPVIVGFCYGLLLGMGKAFEAKRYHMLGNYMQRSWIVLFLCGLLLLPIYIYTAPILKLVGQSDAVSEQTGVVVLWLLPQHFCFAFQFPLQRFLQCHLKNQIISWVTVGGLVVNALASWLLVCVFDFGVVGGSDCFGHLLVVFGVGIVFFVTECSWCPPTWTAFSIQAFSGLWESVKVYVASGFMLCMTISGWEFIIPLAFFAGTEVRVVNKLGAGNGKAAKFETKVSEEQSTIIGLFFCALILILYDKFAYIFTSSTYVIQEEVGKMYFLLAVTVLLNSVQPILSGVAVGTEWQAWTAYINLGCYYMIGLPLGILMGWIFKLGVMAEKASRRVQKWSVPNPENQPENQH